MGAAPLDTGWPEVEIAKRAAKRDMAEVDLVASIRSPRVDPFVAYSCSIGSLQ